MKYLWDTNTAIYFLQKQFPQNAEAFVDGTLDESPPTISVITEIELLCWRTPDEKELEVLHNFLNDITIFELEKNIKLKTAEIRKSHKIKLPDAIIAATALTHSLTLMTRNMKDFIDIQNISLVNPFEQ